MLAEHVLTIWPYFGANQTEDVGPIPRGRRPQRLTIFGKAIEVESWRDVLQNTVNEVIESDVEIFPALCRELPCHIGNDRSRFREARELRNGGFVNVNLSAEGIDRLCRRILDISGVLSTEWTLETR